MRIFVPSAADLLTDHAPHGEGLIAWHLLSGLSARGHDVVACARFVDVQGEAPFEIIELGAGGALESLQPPVVAFHTSRAYRHARRAGEFDVAHWIFPQGSDHILSALPTRLPMVLGPLAFEWPFERRRAGLGARLRTLAEPLYARLHERAIRQTRVALVAVPPVVDRLDPRLRTRAAVVPFGIDVDRFDPDRPLPSRPTILFVGRLEERKGVRELVEAFGRVHATLVGARLRIAGVGPESEWIAGRAAALGLSDCVELLGSVPNDEIGALMADASLLCVPAHAEPFGMALLEAMSCGRAVVACDAGGPPHLVTRNGGALVSPGASDELAEALSGLLADPERLAEIGRLNRARAEREFSWRAVLDQVESAYARACG